MVEVSILPFHRLRFGHVGFEVLNHFGHPAVMIDSADEVEVIRHGGNDGYLQVTPGFPESQAFDYCSEAARVGQLI